MDDVTVSVSEFVALINQSLEYAYPTIRVEGEVSEFRVSKNRWVYFNLQDEESSVRVFGTVYQLKQPIEDGMKVIVSGSPRLHNRYGFSLNMSSIVPSGEGSIKKAFELLLKKLQKEGLFDEARKRPIPKLPQRIGLITSSQAAAYSDFMKILNERWSGLDVNLADVQVQGEAASGQIVRAITYFSQMPDPVDVLVITRGGGSAEDLNAFSTEEVARAVAGSRIPTIVGVGHEIDVSLADMAADVRATTPTNAAQLVVPDKQEFLRDLQSSLHSIGQRITVETSQRIADKLFALRRGMETQLARRRASVEQYQTMLELVNPNTILARGYSLTTDKAGKIIRTAKHLKVGDEVVIKFSQGSAQAEVIDVKN